MSVGEIDNRVRKAAIPGKDTYVLYNSQGVEGANVNCVFDYAAANLAVTGNINTTTLLVTQNISTGNLAVTQNVTAGNCNVANLNVSANISNTGNILVTQNVATGNLKVTQNTSEGNLSVTQNTATGNLTVTQNTSTGNITVTQNVKCGGTANIVQPILVSPRELLSNIGSINNPNTATFDVSITNDFDITTANTQRNNVNVSFTNWAATGNLQTVVVIVRQSGAAANLAQTSANGITWTNTSIKWSNGEVPVLAGFVGKCDVLTFVTVDGGTTVYGAHSLANCG